VGKTDPRPVAAIAVQKRYQGGENACGEPKFETPRHPVGIAFLVSLCQWKLKKNPQEAHDPSQYITIQIQGVQAIF